MTDAMTEKENLVAQPNGQPHAVSSTFIKPQARKPHDPDVTFEEYHFYALRTRVEEQTYEPPKTNWRQILLRKDSKKDEDHVGNGNVPVPDQEATNHLDISDEEWVNASRAFRTASWGACE
jgi:hypothetical protein